MENITDKTIVQLDIKIRWAKLLSQFAKEHPFLNVTIHQRGSADEVADLVRVEFHTHRCSKAEANRRFFYFFLIYGEWMTIYGKDNA